MIINILAFKIIICYGITWHFLVVKNNLVNEQILKNARTFCLLYIMYYIESPRESSVVRIKRVSERCYNGVSSMIL